LDVEILPLDSAQLITDYLEGNGKFSDRQAYPLPSIIFLDGQLHHEPSMGVLRRIRKNPTSSHIPIVVLTGSLDDQVKVDAKEAGAAECFEKPFTAGDWALLKNLLPAHE
jgi:DNA-binding response OmpR family regulator